MSAPTCILPAEPKFLSEIELAVLSGAARALRSRASLQREKATKVGVAAGGVQFPDVVARSPEATVAEKLALTFEQIAADIEMGAPL